MAHLAILIGDPVRTIEKRNTDNIFFFFIKICTYKKNKQM